MGGVLGKRSFGRVILVSGWRLLLFLGIFGCLDRREVGVGEFVLYFDLFWVLLEF